MGSIGKVLKGLNETGLKKRAANMKWIGLTGGIATGKSTVTKFLRTLGYEVLDADQISHQLTQVHGPALNEIFKTFGESVRNQDGSLNRAALGRLVFGRVEEMKKLESILHPLVRAKIAAEKERLMGAGETAVFYDVPLLYEKSMQDEFDAVILVYCKPEQQLERLIIRNSLSQSEAEARIASQIPIDRKLQLADAVIMNTGSEMELEKNLKDVLMKMKLKGKT